MNFAEYIEDLARRHPAIMHSDDECHFSDMTEDAQNALSHTRMNFPCVVLDEGDATFTGSNVQPFEEDSYVILFVDHVCDTADAVEIRSCFKRMKKIAIDFLKKMNRDKNSVKMLARFSVVGVELIRVYLQESALYGYAMSCGNTLLFVDLDCDNVFDN